MESSPFYRRYKPDGNIALAILDSRISVSGTMKFIYYRIPKCANSTLFYSLYRNITRNSVSDIKSLTHLKDNYFRHPSMLSASEMSKCDEFLHFTFVRNPISRFASCYKDKILGGRKGYGKRSKVNKLLGNEPEAEIPLLDFIDFLENGGLYTDTHWAPQTALLVKPLEELDFVGRVESIERDWESLCTLLGVAWKLYTFAPHRTATQKNSALDKQLQSESVMKKIYSLYEYDFLRLGYRDIYKSKV